MTGGSEAVSIVTRALRARGFAYEDRAGSWIAFSGTLHADNDDHAVRVLVDSSGRRPPIVRLTPVPKQLTPVAPHVAADGTLCYLAPGSVVLDVFDLPGQALACVERAESVLTQILRGELVANLQEEFFAFWQGAPCVLDVSASSTTRREAYRMERQGQRFAAVVVTNDKPRTERKLAGSGIRIRGRALPVPLICIQARAAPRPMHGEWPPRNLEQLLKWQLRLEQRSGRRMARLLREVFPRARRAICLVESPHLQYAFAVRFGPLPRFQSGRLRPAVLSPRVLRRSKIYPMSTIRVDDAYVSRRSVPDRGSLGGYKIVLAGCGTIGGFLAELLVKAGAGTDGGRVALVDPDILKPENIGRHRLGFPSVFKNKAQELAAELRRGYPTLEISAFAGDILEYNLKNVDVLVDATGEEALGHMLTSRTRDFVRTLTIWVEGAGAAIRGLLRDEPNAACSRCLVDERRAPHYPVAESEIPYELAGHGCESLYVPFPVTVSVQAACLATDMLADWANASPNPRLRTRVLHPDLVKRTQDCSPLRVTGCPACGT